MLLRNATYTEVATTDTARTTAGYQKTGDLLTLPYTETSLVENHMQQELKMYKHI